MKLFEMVDSGGLLLSLKNYKDQADRKGNSLQIDFASFKRQFNLDDYGISDPERLQQWVEKTQGAKSVIDSVGIKDINEPNPVVVFKTDRPGKAPGQPENNPQTPTVKSMASSAAKQAIDQKI